MILCASPAALMAMQLYFPPSDILAFTICNVRPPERQTDKEMAMHNTHKNINVYRHIFCACVYLYIIPGMIRALLLACTGFLSFSQLRVGGGKPVASQLRETKLFTTTIAFSSFTPTMEGGTGAHNNITIRSSPRHSFYAFNLTATWTAYTNKTDTTPNISSVETIQVDAKYNDNVSFHFCDRTNQRTETSPCTLRLKYFSALPATFSATHT